MRTLAALVAALHYVALAIGMPAIWHRARLLGGSLDRDRLRRVFLADCAWDVAAVLWLLTGAMRVPRLRPHGPLGALDSPPRVA